MEHLLLIEDDQALGRGITLALAAGDREPHLARTLAEGRRLFAQLPISLVILDLNLPDGNGLELLTEIRSVSQVPVLILTANDLESDQVTGLELGADDYVTKPFSLAVLRARVNNLLRRGAVPRGEVVELPPFSFDFAGMAFSRNGEAIELSKTEQLLDRVWDGGEFVDENALSVAVRRLRAKLGDAPIKTVYGLGYTWEIQ